MAKINCFACNGVHELVENTKGKQVLSERKVTSATGRVLINCPMSGKEPRYRNTESPWPGQ